MKILEKIVTTNSAEEYDFADNISLILIKKK